MILPRGQAEGGQFDCSGCLDLPVVPSAALERNVILSTFHSAPVITGISSNSTDTDLRAI